LFRSLAGSILAVLIMSAVPMAAAERPEAGAAPVAPTQAVAWAWAKESGGSSAAVRALYVTYGVTQVLDVVSTNLARSRGAVEANPMMQGGAARGMALKAVTGMVTMLAVRAIEKKSKKAAVITMIGVNVMTAAVVANNIRNAQRLK
jgi:hypothetical protein